jgi:hypothetical protein
MIIYKTFPFLACFYFTLFAHQFKYENRVSHSMLKDTRTIKG